LAIARDLSGTRLIGTTEEVAEKRSAGQQCSPGAEARKEEEGLVRIAEATPVTKGATLEWGTQ